MSEMVKRVALAMEARSAVDPVTIEDVARAAIEAMREPTKAMLGDFPALNRETWDEMIDVALDLCPQDTTTPEAKP